MDNQEVLWFEISSKLLYFSNQLINQNRFRLKWSHTFPCHNGSNATFPCHNGSNAYSFEVIDSLCYIHFCEYMYSTIHVHVHVAVIQSCSCFGFGLLSQ